LGIRQGAVKKNGEKGRRGKNSEGGREEIEREQTRMKREDGWMEIETDL